MYPMSSHLASLALGLIIGSAVTYLAMTLADRRVRPDRRKVAGILESQCPPISVVPLSDHRPGQTALFQQPTIFDRAKPLVPHWENVEIPDSPAALFLRSAQTQPRPE